MLYWRQAFPFIGMTSRLGFDVGVFCVTLTFLGSQKLLALNCWHCLVLHHFLT